MNTTQFHNQLTSCQLWLIAGLVGFVVGCVFSIAKSVRQTQNNTAAILEVLRERHPPEWIDQFTVTNGHIIYVPKQ